jgi:hypothetical protein
MTRIAAGARVLPVLAATLLAACAANPDFRGSPEPSVAPRPTPPRSQIAHACNLDTPNEVAVLDETRDRFHETVCGAALWFDGLFGERNPRAARRAYGRLEVSPRYSEFEGEEVRVRFDAQADLPAFQNRLSAFVGRDDEDDVARDRSEGLGLRSQAQELQTVEDWFAGLGYKLGEGWGIRSQFRLGVRGVGPSEVFAQLRNIWTAYEDDAQRFRVRATPFVNNIDGAGFTGGVDYDHTLGPTRLLRLGTIGTVTEEGSGMNWRAAALLYQNLREYRAIAFEVFERGATTAPVPVVEYGVRVIYRQPLFKRRLFIELVPGYSWPQVDPALPREGSAGITFGLELPFGTES